MKIRISFALLLMGFSTLLAQTLLVREFLISFYGNELIIGIILANWLILVASGSILASRYCAKISHPILVYTSLQALIAWYLPLSVLIIRMTKNILGLGMGEGIGISPAIFSSFLILAPLCILLGAQFPFGCRIFTDFFQRPLEAAGCVYILEALGFILAGPAITYLLITKLNSLQIAFLVGILNLSCAILLLKREVKPQVRKRATVFLAVFLVLLLFIYFSFSEKLHYLSINKQYRPQKILAYRNSLYANLVVTQTGKQYNFYSNGMPIITIPFPDIFSVEELAHLVCLSHKQPRNLLLISGGPGGLLKEILKHPLQKVDYIEIDPTLIELTKKFSQQITAEELNDPRLTIKYIDARRFVLLAKDKYDVIILNLPIPSTLQLNRFFTKEFFQKLKTILGKDGIFALRLPGSLSYISEAQRKLNASILNTLRDEFAFLRIIPGETNLYLAAKSNFTISPEILISRMKERNIQARLISESYLRYRLSAHWLNWFNASMHNIRQIKSNSDLLPAAVFYSVAYWNAQFSPGLNPFFRILDKLNLKILFSSLCLIGLVFFFFQRATSNFKKLSLGFAIASTGFTGMSVNLMLIFSYQSFYGFVFQHFALLITAFMAGLGLGSWLVTRALYKIKKEITFFAKIELALIIFCLSLVILLSYLDKSPTQKLSFIFFLLSSLCGCLVGAEFPLANKIYGQEKQNYSRSAGILYGLDLAGSWLATLLISIALVTLIGITKTCLFLAALKLISFVLITDSAKRAH